MRLTPRLARLAPLVEGQPELYWVGSRLHSHLQAALRSAGACRQQCTTSSREPRPLVECLGRLVQEDPPLADHLAHTGVLAALPCAQLWARGLAQLFLPALLPRLWDKVIGGSVKILVYVLAAAVSRCRVELLAVGTAEQAVLVLTGMKEDRQEAVLALGTEFWELDGCPLVPGDREDDRLH